MSTRILVIEDDPTIGDVLQDALQREGYHVTLCRNGEDGFFQAITQPFSMVLLDVVLPGRDGLQILAGLRQHNAQIPVLMLSTQDALAQRVEAFSLMADDYLGKPFALVELLARIRALLRRSQPVPTAVTKLQVGSLHLDLITRQVSRAGKPVNLTLKEFEILEYLMKHSGKIVSRAMLMQDVWQGVDRVTPLDNVIDVHMSRLRRKLNVPGKPDILETVRGVGFCLQEQLSDTPLAS